MSDNSEGASGFLDQSKTSSAYNALFFQVMQMLAARAYCMPVKIIAVESAGELAMTGLLDVQPMVNQIDGSGVAIPHGIIHGIPYFRMQGGVNAVIMDPAVGDIGMMMCCDRDITNVKSTQDIANPGSDRRADYADGVYFGGLLNGIPTQYVQFDATGIKIHSPHKITLDATEEIDLVAPIIAINASTSTTITTGLFKVIGPTQLQGTMSVSGLATLSGGARTTGELTNDGKDVGDTHTHNMALIAAGAVTKPTSTPL